MALLIRWCEKRLVGGTTMNETKTEWQSVPEFPKYEVSEDGRVRNVMTGVTLKPKNGWVNLRRDGEGHAHKVSRLVNDARGVPTISLIEGEAWARIEGFPHAVSNLGRVINIKTGRVLESTHGQAHLRCGMLKTTRNVRVAVARAFGGCVPKKGNYKHGMGLGLVKGTPDTFWTIYALIDPRNFSPFYVGVTRFPQQRLAAHLCPSTWAKHGGEYERRMQELKAASLRPYFGVLETTNDRRREAWHIAETQRLGFGLANTDGTGKGRKPYKLRRLNKRRVGEDRAVAAAIAKMRERRERNKAVPKAA
jgi:hypothetical protein